MPLPTTLTMLSLQAQAEAIAGLYVPPDVGRPSDIADPIILKQFLEAIADGNYMETACHLVGLSKVTVHNWTKRGEAGEVPFDRFVNAVKAAEARAEAKMVANVRKASELPQFWAAAATHLERRHPDRWGKRQDDAQVPRVVVQIGVGQGEVKVGLLVSPPTFAPDSPEVDTANSLTGQAFALPSRPITAVMSSLAEPCQASESAPSEAGSGEAISCGRIPKGPLPGRAGARPRRRHFLGKGRVAGRERKKGAADGAA